MGVGRHRRVGSGSNFATKAASEGLDTVPSRSAERAQGAARHRKVTPTAADLLRMGSGAAAASAALVLTQVLGGSHASVTPTPPPAPGVGASPFDNFGATPPAGHHNGTDSSFSPSTPMPTPPGQASGSSIAGHAHFTPKPGEKLPGLYPNDGFSGARAALTFDDGPNPATTPRILDILKEQGVHATFFVTGENAAKYPELVRRIVAEGHELGAHSWDHDNLSKMTESQVKADLARTEAAVNKALGMSYPLSQVRPPYGAVSSAVRAAIGPERENVLWNVDTLDWKHRSSKKTVENVFDPATGVSPTDGGVILMHDIHASTVPAVEPIIDGLKLRGYDIVTTGDLLDEKYS